MTLSKNRAFTLSEVLITIGILGIIASITIPTLISATNKNNYVTGLKKANVILRTATSELMLDNGGTMQNLFATDTYAIADKFCTKLNCIKKCVHSNTEGCFPTGVKGLYGGIDASIPTCPNHGAILSNGMLICYGYYTTACNGVYYVKGGQNLSCVSRLWIDINGMKQPNTLGRDIFRFIIYRDGIVPGGVEYTPETSSYYCNPTVTDIYGAMGCAGRVLKEGKMNY